LSPYRFPSSSTHDWTVAPPSGHPGSLQNRVSTKPQQPWPRIRVSWGRMCILLAWHTVTIAEGWASSRTNGQPLNSFSFLIKKWLLSTSVAEAIPLVACSSMIHASNTDGRGSGGIGREEQGVHYIEHEPSTTDVWGGSIKSISNFPSFPFEGKSGNTSKWLTSDKDSAEEFEGKSAQSTQKLQLMLTLCIYL
jgi:hypothetical protein